MQIVVSKDSKQDNSKRVYSNLWDYYTKIFVPLAKINTVRVLLSSTINLHWSSQSLTWEMPLYMARYLKKYIWIFHHDAWGQTRKVKRCAY